MVLWHAPGKLGGEARSLWEGRNSSGQGKRRESVRAIICKYLLPCLFLLKSVKMKTGGVGRDKTENKNGEDKPARQKEGAS